MRTCCIFGAGDYSAKEPVIDQNKYIIAADGGIEYLNRLGVLPNLIIGDMDSVLNFGEIMKQYKNNPKIEMIRLSPEKDDTDMLAAIKFGLEKGYDYFEIYGGIGDRLDHIWANVQCLNFLLEHNAKGILIGSQIYIEIIKDEIKYFPKEKKGIISIFSYGEKAVGVNLKGLKYPLINATVTNAFPIGVSNEFTGIESNVEVKSGKLLLIYQ